MTNQAALLSDLAAVVGAADLLTGDATTGKEQVWETHQPCNAMALLRPSSTAQVAEILRICHAASQPVVPYGGITNLVQACATTPQDIALSLEKLNKIEELDTTAQTMVAQAGVTMQQAQEAADDAGLFFPVDIVARGNCMLGGNVSTNAGGTKVIRYGMTRDSVLGLEAVLADGTLISSMNRYIKNNSGFDLKHLFIGTEGLLGVVTRIVFRLSIKPTTHNVALVACADFDKVVEVLGKSRSLLGNSLCGFEVMWDTFYDKATKPQGRLDSPLTASFPLYAIIESMGTSPRTDDDLFMEALSAMSEDGLILDGVVAKSDKEREEIWAIRGEVEWLVRKAQNFDVSLRSADVGRYVDDVSSNIMRDVPNALVAAFGHLGDNNIHVSVLGGSPDDGTAATIERHIYESLSAYEGAISAEHGIGLEKKQWLPISRTDNEIALMHALKKMMDPSNILNRGKVL